MTESISQLVQSTSEGSSAEDKQQGVDRALRAALVERYARLFTLDSKGDSFASYFDTATAWEGEGILTSLSKKVGKQDAVYTYEHISEAVNSAFTSGGHQAVVELLESLLAKLPKYMREEKSDRVVNHFYIEHPPDYLQEAGFGSDDELLEIHIDDIYKHPEISLREGVRKQLGDVAVDIVRNHPEIQGVYGVSWLMDTNLAQKFGFHVLQNYTGKSGISGHSRGQLISKDGAVNEKRLQQYIAGEDLPYEVRCGYMTSEEFLQEFLPEQEKSEAKMLLKHNKSTWEHAVKIRIDQKQFEKSLNMLMGMGYAYGESEGLTPDKVRTKISTEFPYLCEFLVQQNLLDELVQILPALIEVRRSELKQSDSANSPEDEWKVKMRLWSNKYHKAFKDFAYIPTEVSFQNARIDTI